MRILAIAGAMLTLPGCGFIPAAYGPTAVSAAVSLVGIANADALSFLKFTSGKKACPVPAGPVVEAKTEPTS